MALKDTTAWLDKIEADTPKVEKRLPDGPVTYEPHDGETSDGSYLYADLYAEPDLPEA
jgi:hypothetical protein